MFKHKEVHQCTWHHDTLGQMFMIGLVVMSTEFQQHVLDRRGVELSTNHHMVVI